MRFNSTSVSGLYPGRSARILLQAHHGGLAARLRQLVIEQRLQAEKDRAGRVDERHVMRVRIVLLAEAERFRIDEDLQVFGDVEVLLRRERGAQFG